MVGCYPVCANNETGETNPLPTRLLGPRTIAFVCAYPTKNRTHEFFSSTSRSPNRKHRFRIDFAVASSERATERTPCRPPGEPAAAHRRSARGPEPDELYQIAARLCDAGEFAHALPIALHLAGRPEREARYAFLAGSCLQRLDHPHVALGMFGLSTINEAESPTPGPLLRSGECLAAMGLNDRAIEAFEAAVEIARSDSEYAQLQDIALEKAALLRNAH